MGLKQHFARISKIPFKQDLVSRSLSRTILFLALFALLIATGYGVEHRKDQDLFADFIRSYEYGLCHGDLLLGGPLIPDCRIYDTDLTILTDVACHNSNEFERLRYIAIGRQLGVDKKYLKSLKCGRPLDKQRISRTCSGGEALSYADDIFISDMPSLRRCISGMAHTKRSCERFYKVEVDPLDHFEISCLLRRRFQRN